MPSQNPVQQNTIPSTSPPQSPHRIKASFIILFAITLLIGAAGGYYFGIKKGPLNLLQRPTACTQEAKLCPDGSSVGRAGPNCEFAPCPTHLSSTSKPTGKTQTENKLITSKNGYSLELLPGWYVIDDAVNDNEFMLRNCKEGDLCMENVVAIRFADSLKENPKNLPILDWVNEQNFTYSEYGYTIEVKKELITVASKPAVKVSDEKYDYLRVYIPIGSNVLEVFATIASGGPNYVKEHLNDLDQILSTFEFTQ